MQISPGELRDRLIARYPRLAAEAGDDEDSDVLALYTALRVFRQSTEQAFLAGRTEEVREHFVFLDGLYDACDCHSQNAVLTGYFEDLAPRRARGPSIAKRGKFREMKALLPPRAVGFLPNDDPMWK